LSVPARAYLSIGEVLTKLRGDFPDITISKIRFLESEGLIEPQRTPSGYRKFTTVDLERLRYVLLAQRDQYLPLKVIKENLDALDRGLQPAPAGGTPSPRPTLATVDGEFAPAAFAVVITTVTRYLLLRQLQRWLALELNLATFVPLSRLRTVRSV
jgi:DNA-binding transcriptional MerR regulator